MTFNDILMKVYKGDLSTVPDCLLCLGPGETTGWCVFEKGVLTLYGQTPTYDKETEQINWGEVNHLIQKIKPTHVVCENYRVYAHKLERHSFSEVPTIRIIGGFELLCFLGVDETVPMDLNFRGETMESSYKKHWQIPMDYQMAVQAKGFVDDAKLKKWDSELYSVVGAAGELFSIRTNLYTPVEPDTILDDFMIPMHIALQGYRIVYEPDAYASELASAELS